MPNSKKIFIKDKEGNYLLPITDASFIQYLNSYSQNETVKHALDELNSYVGGIGDITTQITNKINDLDSDTKVNQPNKYDASDTEHLYPYKDIPTNSWLTYIQIQDGKITQAYYSEINAEQVKYAYVETIVDETGTHTYNAVTPVSERLTYLLNYTTQLAYETANNAQQSAKTAGISNIYAENDSSVKIIQTPGFMSDGTTYVDKIKVGVKIKNDDGLIYVDDDTNTTTGDYILNGQKLLTLGTFSYSHVDNLETYLHVIENSIATNSTNITRNIENDIYSHLYETPIPEDGYIVPGSYTLASLYNNYNNVIKTFGEAENSTETELISYFNSSNTVKNTTDYLYKKSYEDKINLTDERNGLSLTNAVAPNTGRILKVNTDNDTIIINSDNELTANLFIKYVKDDVTVQNPKHQIILYSKVNGVDVQIGDAIDASDFVKDSFLASAILIDPVLPGTTTVDTSKPAKSILQLVWNTTDADGHTIPSSIPTTDIDLTQFIKPYKASNNGIFLNDQTFSLGIYNGLEYSNYIIDSYTFSYIGIKLDNDNESEFLTVSQLNGVKLNNVRSTINSSVTPITTGIKDAHNLVLSYDNVSIMTPAKAITDFRTIINNDKTFGFEYENVILNSENIQHSWIENKIVDNVNSQILHNDSINTYITILGTYLDNLKSQLGNGSTVTQIVEQYLSALTYTIRPENEYAGLVINSITQTNGAVNQLSYAYVDEFILQQSLTPSAKANAETHKADSHEKLQDALSYLISENARQDISINDVATYYNNITANINNVTVAVDNAHDTDKFHSSSYVNIHTNDTTYNGIHTTAYTIQVNDIASATTLHNINAELSSGNNVVTDTDKILTDADKHTDGALFFQSIGYITLNIDLFK